jgi:hypothetical protein
VVDHCLVRIFPYVSVALLLPPIVDCTLESEGVDEKSGVQKLFWETAVELAEIVAVIFLPLLFPVVISRSFLYLLPQRRRLLSGISRE